MKPIVCALLLLVSTVIRSRVSLQLEIVALRHQLAVYQRTVKRPQIGSGDRILWSWLSRHWSGWRDALVFVQTGTVIVWQRKRFRDHWAKLSQHGRPGRPQVPEEIRALIRKMPAANISWVRHGLSGSYASSALMWLNQPWRSTGCGPGSHRSRHGRLS
jgi:putative transposase